MTWASVGSGLVLLDVFQGGGLEWAFFPVSMWFAFGVVPRFIRLWNAGYSWRDVFLRPPAPDAIRARAQTSVPLPAATSDEFGSEIASINQARADRQAILRIVEKLPKSERKMLPDVQATADALLERAEQLARAQSTMSAGVDEARLKAIEQRIAQTNGEPEGEERERQLGLLQRQRQALTDLLSRRRSIQGQIESCVLAMQNVRFDLLRLKSAGVAAVLDDLTHATQQARALSRDVDHAIAAAGEIREVLGEQSPPPPSRRVPPSPQV